MEEGFAAQKKSIVMLKNKENVLPLQKKMKVYVPKIHWPESVDWMCQKMEEHWDSPISQELLEKYFTVTDHPEEADAAICIIRQPDGAAFGLAGGYDVSDKEAGGNGCNIAHTLPFTRGNIALPKIQMMSSQIELTVERP